MSDIWLMCDIDVWILLLRPGAGIHGACRIFQARVVVGWYWWSGHPYQRTLQGRQSPCPVDLRLGSNGKPNKESRWRILKVSLGNGGRGISREMQWPLHFGHAVQCSQGAEMGREGLGKLKQKQLARKAQGPCLIIATRNDWTAVAKQHSHVIFHVVKYSPSNVNSGPN